MPWREFASVGSVNIVAKLVGLVSWVWLARCLEPSALGVVAFLLACQIPLQRVISLNLAPILVSATHQASDRDTKAVFRHFTILRLTIAAACALIWISACVVAWVTGHNELGISGIILAPLLLTQSINYFAAAQRYNKVFASSVLDFISLSAVALGMFLILHPKATPREAASVYTLCNLIGMVFGLYWGYRLLAGFYQADDKVIFKRHVRLTEAVWPLVISLAAYVYTALEIPLVSWLYGFKASGIYRVGSTLPGGILTLVGSAAAILYPRYVEWSSDRALLAIRLRQLGWGTAVVCIVGTLFVSLSGRSLLKIIFGSAYEDSYTILVILAAAKLVVLWVNVWSNSLFAMREEKYVGKVILFASVTCITANLLLAPLGLGPDLVAGLSLCAELIVGVLCWARVKVLLSVSEPRYVK